MPIYHAKNKNCYKAIFLDVDGTLLPGNGKPIPESGIEAMKKAQEQGILLFIATGRHKNELDFDQWTPHINFEGYITLNGQLDYSKDSQVIYKNPIHSQDIKQVVRFLKENPQSSVFLEEDDIYTNMIDELLRKTYVRLGLELPKVMPLEYILERELYMMVTYSGDGRPPFMHLLNHCDFAETGAGWDIFSKGMNKWLGVLRFLKRYNISPEESVAIGDNENDIGMLLGAGYSIVMGNATDYVKKHADFVTGHIDNDGLSEGIMHILSNQGQSA